MAKYTELLSEYIENGGQLPAAFDNIEGFEDLFLGYYCDHEIGFETPTLFAMKLETTANLVIPVYVKRLAELEAAEEALQNPQKKRVKTGSITRTTGKAEKTQTFTNADHVRTEAELPFAGQNADQPPTRVNTDKGYEDKIKEDAAEHTDTETYNSVTDTESGYTPSEAATLFEALEAKAKLIKLECLQEFSNLFMKVY